MVSLCHENCASITSLQAERMTQRLFDEAPAERLPSCSGRLVRNAQALDRNARRLRERGGQPGVFVRCGAGICSLQYRDEDRARFVPRVFRVSAGVEAADFDP